MATIYSEIFSKYQAQEYFLCLCVYNKLYCTMQNMRYIFSFDIPIVILGKIRYNLIGNLVELGKGRKIRTMRGEM